MNKNVITYIVVALALAVLGFFGFNSLINNGTRAPGAANYRDAEFVIDGKKVKINSDGVQYFGNELKTDLNGDGREDVAFIVTLNGGGTGTFFYAVAALNTKNGWVGTDGYLLGDRIAPQSTNLSPNPKQQYVVVFNYTDRAPGDPMVAEPSVGKSAYLKLNPTSMQWGVVEPNFEGESR